MALKNIAPCSQTKTYAKHNCCLKTKPKVDALKK